MSLSILALALQAAVPGAQASPAPAQVAVPGATTAAATTLSPDACYRLDDRVADLAIGATGTGFDSLYLLAFQAPPTGDVITELECQLFGGYSGNPYAGGPMAWCIYEDPTDDYDPSDAVLVWTTNDTAVAQPSNNGLYQSVAVPDVSVSGVWWAAYALPGVQGGEFPAGFSTEVPSYGRAWEATASFGALDINNPANNSYFADIAAGCCDGVWHIRANGQNCIDVDGCYVNDQGVVDQTFGFDCGQAPTGQTTDWLMMNSFVADGDDLIRELRAQFGHPTLGAGAYDPNLPIEWAIWEDPNDDGDPNDLVLVWSAMDTIGSDLGTGGFRSITVPEVQVTDSFFIGVVFRDNPDSNAGTPMNLDTSGPSFGRSWVGYQTGAFCGTSIDVADLSTVGGLARTTDASSGIGLDGTWMLRANGWDCACGDITTYCTAAPNTASTDGARISTMGSTSVTANDLTLIVDSCPPNATGIILSGTDKLNFPLSNGFLCVFGTPIHRIDAVQAGGGGTVTYALDQMDLAPGQFIAAGDTVNFQLWYRDMTGTGANLSDAVAVTFCP